MTEEKTNLKINQESGQRLETENTLQTILQRNFATKQSNEKHLEVGISKDVWGQEYFFFLFWKKYSMFVCCELVEISTHTDTLMYIMNGGELLMFSSRFKGTGSSAQV